MQIITKSYFSKENQLNIPLSTTIPTAGVSAPSNQNYIDSLCEKIERELLLNALGLTLYREFQIALGDIDIVANAKWKKLLNGTDYNVKNWIGLNHDFSLIAQKVFEIYLTETNSFLTQSGTVQTNSENAKLVTPAYKIANSSQSFIKQYQGVNSNEPIVYDNFTDWSGDFEDVEVSLYRYLMDNKEDFPTWNESNFRFYETKNSFGI